MLTSAEPTWRWVPDVMFSGGTSWDLMLGAEHVGWIIRCADGSYTACVYPENLFQRRLPAMQTAAGWLLAQAGAK